VQSFTFDHFQIFSNNVIIMSLTSKELYILNSIIIASDNDPNRPEFPADDPKFPATPTYHIKVPGFENVWIKDESHNPTGTHKDRMAWEIVVTYRDFLLAKQNGQITDALLPMSIISSGSAALAIQTQFRKYNLPDLKVLLDIRTDPVIMNSLENIGCEVYETDLDKKQLNSKDILALTHN
jgi:cysteine synthase